MAVAAAASPQGSNEPFNKRQALALAALTVKGHATTVSVFLRRGFGSEALGANGVAAGIIILVYGGLTNAPEMITFLWVWLAAVIFQRIYSFGQRRNGDVVHSRYSGWPEVGMRFTKSERLARELIEPLVCIVVGAVVWPLSGPLGRFILLGSVSLLISLGLDQQAMRNRMRAMRDAEIEQRYLSDVFNGRRDD